MTRIELPNPPRRVLLIKPSALGDIVHTLPVLNLLRRRWPQAHISWLIGSAFADLIRGHPQLDETITFNRKRFASSWRNPRAAIELVQFLRDLRKRDFDLVIDLQGLLRSGMLTALTRAPARIGFSNARELAHLFYTHHIPVDTMEQHAIERYLNVTEALGCGRSPVDFNFVTDERDRARVGGLLGGIARFAVLLPGTNWMTKRWPVEKFASLVRPLSEKFGLSTVVAGGPEVSRIADELIRLGKPDLQVRLDSPSDAARKDRLAADDGPRVINLAGQTTLRELVVLLQRAQLVIANDSGPMHIAAALGKPLVTMFGPTNPVRTGPYHRPESVVRVDIPCSPCYSRKCSHVSCMHWIDAQNVIEIAEVQLKSPGKIPMTNQ